MEKCTFQPNIAESSSTLKNLTKKPKIIIKGHKKASAPVPIEPLQSSNVLTNLNLSNCQSSKNNNKSREKSMSKVREGN